MASELFSRCYHCGLPSAQNTFKYFDNRKADQPRYQCHECKKLFTLGSHGRPQGRTYAKKRNEDPEELKGLSRQCRHCGVADHAPFRYYNNHNLSQPRFKCLSCSKQFQMRLLGTGAERRLVHTSARQRQVAVPRRRRQGVTEPGPNDDVVPSSNSSDIVNGWYSPFAEGQAVAPCDPVILSHEPALGWLSETTSSEVEEAQLASLPESELGLAESAENAEAGPNLFWAGNDDGFNLPQPWSVEAVDYTQFVQAEGNNLNAEESTAAAEYASSAPATINAVENDHSYNYALPPIPWSHECAAADQSSANVNVEAPHSVGMVLPEDLSAQVVMDVTDGWISDEEVEQFMSLLEADLVAEPETEVENYAEQPPAADPPLPWTNGNDGNSLSPVLPWGFVPQAATTESTHVVQAGEENGNAEEKASDLYPHVNVEEYKKKNTSSDSTWPPSSTSSRDAYAAASTKSMDIQYANSSIVEAPDDIDMALEVMDVGPGDGSSRDDPSVDPSPSMSYADAAIACCRQMDLDMAEGKWFDFQYMY